MKTSKLIGRLVRITDKESQYYNEWGYVSNFDGDVYSVTGGSIPETLAPIFDRDQFICPRKINLVGYENVPLWKK